MTALMYFIHLDGLTINKSQISCSEFVSFGLRRPTWTTPCVNCLHWIRPTIVYTKDLDMDYDTNR